MFYIKYSLLIYYLSIINLLDIDSNMADWISFSDKNQKLCKINVFDDGNQLLENKFKNLWKIIATNNKGKSRLQNINDKNEILYSISTWKLILLN